MYPKRKDFLWTTILALACLFFAGQAWAQCTDPGDVDTDGDTIMDSQDNCINVPNLDQADADGDGAGDVCDVCPDDPDDDADGDDLCGDVDNCPSKANAGQADADADGVGDDCDHCPGEEGNDCAAGLDVITGCDTYKGLHPITKDALACCSGRATPECLSGQDIPCYVEYEFCADGTVYKTWDPAPDNALVGHATAPGTWYYDVTPTGAYLVIDTLAAGAFPTATVERHGSAVTYGTDGQRVLNWNGTIQIDVSIPGPGDGTALIGPTLQYMGDDNTLVCVGAGCPFLNMDVDVTRAVALTDNGDGTADWAQTTTTTTVSCTSSMGLCTPDPAPTVSTGTIPNDPAELKGPVGGVAYFLVLETQLELALQ